MHQNPEIMTEKQLVGICLDFFEAGSESASSTLSWIMMYLALYPDEQQKCYEEITAAVGKLSFL